MQTEGGPGEGPTGALGRVVDGRYELLAQLGQGGMGVVWRAQDRRLNRPVAVKELRLRGSVDPGTRADWVARARREAEAVARVGHEHVVSVHDVIEEAGQVWIVMEQVNPRSLADLLSAHGRLPARDAARIALEVLRGLRAVHGEGVLHRDVKPHNVLFRRDGRAVLMDFGIATFDGAQQVTRVHETIGTPAYIAPELVEHQAPSQSSDLWSLGVTLFEMVEGGQPFNGPTPYEVLEAVRTQQPRPLEHAGPLAPVVRGLMVKAPGERLAAHEAEELLQHVAQETPSSPPYYRSGEHVVRPRSPGETGSLPPGGAGGSGGGGTGAREEGAGGQGTGGAGRGDPGAGGEGAGGAGGTPGPPAASGGNGAAEAPPGARPPAPGGGRTGAGRGRWQTPWVVAAAAALCLAVLSGLGWFTVDRLRAQADPLTASQTLRAAKSRHQLVVGVKTDQPGTSALVGGEYQGFEIDLARYVARRLGFGADELRFLPVLTTTREPLLRSGRVDLVVGGYTMTAARRKKVSFAGPYYTANEDFLVRRDEPPLVEGPRRFYGRTVCTESGSTALAYLRQAFPGKMRIRTYDSYRTCVDDLRHGKVAAIAADDVVLAGYEHEYPTELRRVDQPVTDENYGVGIPQGDPSLRTAVCRALDSYVRSGRWQESYDTNLSALIQLGPRPPRPCPSG